MKNKEKQVINLIHKSKIIIGKPGRCVTPPWPGVFSKQNSRWTICKLSLAGARHVVANFRISHRCAIPVRRLLLNGRGHTLNIAEI